MAKNINANLESVGFKNINVESRPDLAVLSRTNMPALLVEVGFIDSEKDNQIFDTRFDEIAQAIADGIMETLQGRTAEANAPVYPRFAYQAPAQPKTSDAPAWTPFMPKSQPLPQEKDEEQRRPLYRVQVGAFYNLQNAIELEQELKKLGYNTWIVTV